MSIRFYKDHEVRAVWDEKKSAWWFSIVDIVGAVTDSPNPRKYWSVLKTRLKRAGNELICTLSLGHPEHQGPVSVSTRGEWWEYKA